MNEDNKSAFDFDMSEALDEFKNSYGAKEKTLSGLKLFGKGLFKSVKYVVTDGLPAVAEHAMKTTLENSKKHLSDGNLSDEQRSRLETIRDKSNVSLNTLEERKKSKKSENSETE